MIGVILYLGIVFYVSLSFPPIDRLIVPRHATARNKNKNKKECPEKVVRKSEQGVSLASESKTRVQFL